MDVIDYVTSKAFLSAVIVPLISGSLAAASVGYWKSHVLRRKALVAEAYKVALDRVEAVYWIRRRTRQISLRPQDEIDVRNQLHDVQRQTEYYKGLLSIEAKWFGKSYSDFVAAITKATGPLLKVAWQEAPSGPGGDLSKIVHPKVLPEVKKAEEEFLHDARAFFNIFKRTWRRITYKEN